MYLIETFFWRDNWIEEQPVNRWYGTKEQAEAYLNLEFEKNKDYDPTLKDMELSYSTDSRRNYMVRCFELTPLP